MTASEDNTHYIAECCCGQCRIEISGEPEIHGVCHCKNCRKRTGSAFGISTYFSKAQIIAQQGNLNVYSLHNKEQNHDQERFFCANCGTTLYWLISTMPDKIGIAGGCFIDPPLKSPSYSVNDNQRIQWLTLPEHWLTQP